MFWFKDEGLGVRFKVHRRIKDNDTHGIRCLMSGKCQHEGCVNMKSSNPARCAHEDPKVHGLHIDNGM